jgi:hypothetical protein
LMITFFLNTRRAPKDPVTASFHSSTCGRYNFARRTFHQLAQKNQKFEDKAFYFAGNTLELKMQSNRVHECRRHQTPVSSRRFRRGAEAERSTASFRRRTTAAGCHQVAGDAPLGDEGASSSNDGFAGPPSWRLKTCRLAGRRSRGHGCHQRG